MANCCQRAIRSAFPAQLLHAFWVLLLFSPFHHVCASDLSRPLLGMRIDGADYVSLSELSRTTGGRLDDVPHAHKVKLCIGDRVVVFTRLSSVVTIDEEVYRLPLPTRYSGQDLYAPVQCLSLLARTMGIVLEARIDDARPQASTQVPDAPVQRLDPPPQPVKVPAEEMSDGAERKAKVPAEKKNDGAERMAEWTLKTVIIDPGHGGKDPGAIGQRGTQEKDIVLEVAKRLKKQLEKDLQVEVVLTRENDHFIPLYKRSRIALAQQGKIFVSLHCNATPNQNASGVEVYFLSEAKTKAAAEVARRENEVLHKYEDASADTLSNLLDVIRFGLLSTQFLKESQDLAADIHREIAQQAPGVVQRGVKQANFYVMRGTMGHMPSVLVELGFITHRQEEKHLRSSAYQQTLAEAVCRGIQTFKKRYERQLSTGL